MREVYVIAFSMFPLLLPSEKKENKRAKTAGRKETTVSRRAPPCAHVKVRRWPSAEICVPREVASSGDLRTGKRLRLWPVAMWPAKREKICIFYLILGTFLSYLPGEIPGLFHESLKGPKTLFRACCTHFFHYNAEMWYFLASKTVFNLETALSWSKMLLRNYKVKGREYQLSTPVRVTSCKTAVVS